jgi:hypothetical protein
MQLTNVQIQDVLANLARKESGLNELFGFTLNALMLGDRNVFLSDKKVSNKGNHFYYPNFEGIVIISRL